MTPARAEAGLVMASAALEGQDGGNFPNQKLQICLCKVSTGYGTEVARRSATKEDCCRISVLTFKKQTMLDQHQQFRVLGLCHDATTAQLNDLILTNVLGLRRRPSSSNSSSDRVQIGV